MTSPSNPKEILDCQRLEDEGSNDKKSTVPGAADTESSGDDDDDKPTDAAKNETLKVAKDFVAAADSNSIQKADADIAEELIFRKEEANQADQVLDIQKRSIGDLMAIHEDKPAAEEPQKKDSIPTQAASPVNPSIDTSPKVSVEKRDLMSEFIKEAKLAEKTAKMLKLLHMYYLFHKCLSSNCQRPRALPAWTCRAA